MSLVARRRVQHCDERRNQIVTRRSASTQGGAMYCARPSLPRHQPSPSHPAASTGNNQGWGCSTGMRVGPAGVGPAGRRERAARQGQVCGGAVAPARAKGATWAVLWGRGPPPERGWVGPPCRRAPLEGLGARPATDVLPGIGLALGGWASRALQSERPGEG